MTDGVEDQETEKQKASCECDHSHLRLKPHAAHAARLFGQMLEPA